MPPTTLTVSPLTATIEVGGTVQLTATPSTGVKWSITGGCACASVSSTGLVTGLAAGTAMVTARRGHLTATVQITVSGAPVPPTARFTVQSPIQVLELVAVDASGTVDPDGFLASGTLTFGDGSIAITWVGSPPAPAVLSHAYALVGTYTITLTVVDNLGYTGETSTQVVVVPPPDPPPDPPENLAPTASLAVISGQFAGQPVTFSTLGSADPEGALASYTFARGDGTTVGPIATPPPATLLHTYASPGSFTARLTVVDSGGLTAFAEVTVTIQAVPATNVPPVAALARQSGVLLGDPFVFATLGTHDADGTIASWTINYGDGTGAGTTGVPPATLTRTYTSAGAKTVVFQVTDDDGAVGTAQITVSVGTVPVPAPSGLNWASFAATYVLEPFKLVGEEETDLFWFHLHEGHAGAESFTLGLRAWSEDTAVPNRRNIPLANLPAGHQLRYEVRGVPVTGWIDLTTAGAGVTVTLATVAAAGITTGIHDLSLRVQGPQVGNFQPIPSFLHVFRTGAPVEATVPAISRNDQSTLGFQDYPQDGARTGPGIVYVNVADRVFTGKPVQASMTPWTTAPYAADLFVEEMQPHANLFMPMQMWWEEPPGTVSAGLKFVRGIPPKFHGEDARILYSETFNPAGGWNEFGYKGQRSFPFKDGPRGVAWTSPFITGQVDSTGGFAFVEAGGPLRYMKADGEIITVAGWVTDPAKDPVWFLKPVDLIRQNQVLKGTWSSGQYANNSGFRLPLDVAIDPLNENEWYVVGFYDHCVWKVVTNAARTTATVSVFAGDVNHAFGYVDATGTAARFKGPGSIVFCPTADCLYVADQDNDCIRKITRAGVVTTLFGTPNYGQALVTAGGAHGATEFSYDAQVHNFDRLENRALSPRFTCSAGQSPNIYIPYTVRVFSNGDLCVADMGFGSARRIKLNGETTLIGEFALNTNWVNSGRYWLWLDVDRWGNSGPLDGVYFASVVSSGIPGEAAFDRHINEVFAWFPGDGSYPGMRWISGPDSDMFPDGWGARAATDLAHYPWLVAVDPRGGLLMSGIGEHGISRMRSRRATDPVPTNYSAYQQGKFLWHLLRYNVPGGYVDFSVGNPTPILLYGSEAHNMLGFTDAWSLAGATDQQLLDAFGIPSALQADTTARGYLVNFLRVNAGPV